MRLLSLAFVLYSHSMNSLLFYYFEPVLLRKYRTRDHVLIVKVYQLLWWRTLWVRPKSRRKCRWSRWGVGRYESTHDSKPRFFDAVFLQIHRSLYWKEKLWLNIRMLIKVSFSLATIWSRVWFEMTSYVCSEKYRISMIRLALHSNLCRLIQSSSIQISKLLSSICVTK